MRVGAPRLVPSIGRPMKSFVLWAGLFAWIALTAAILWFFNPISALDFAEICSSARSEHSDGSTGKR
jgi:hypothetical protein